jgi:predicted TIM-barrel fold metal-dependent hydrolase
VNERLLRDGYEAMVRSGGLLGEPSSPTIGLWMDAVRELRRCVTELGFKGLRVVPWLWEAAPTDRRYYPLYAACVELGVPFCTQVGHTGPPAALRSRC